MENMVQNAPGLQSLDQKTTQDDGAVKMMNSMTENKILPPAGSSGNCSYMQRVFKCAHIFCISKPCKQKHLLALPSVRP